MGRLIDHRSGQSTKLLAVGYSGTGKTGALAALAAEGWKLRIADFDNGLDILRSYLTDPNSPYVKKNPKAIDNVEFITFRSKYKKSPDGKILPQPRAWANFVAALQNWQDFEEIDEGGKVTRKPIEGTARGPVTSWGSDVVLVVDSFTAMNDSALDYTLQLNARLGQGIRESDWGDGQQVVKLFLNDITSPDVKCNVVLLCHIKDVARDNEPSRLMPSALGKALPPEIPRFFNTMLEFRNVSGKRKIMTRQIGSGLELKTSAPLKVKPEYELEWGLAEYFRAVQE